MNLQFLSSIILFLLVSFSIQAQNHLPITRDQFKNPPDQYYPMPFWHMNGEMTREGILQQLEDAKFKAGFAGVAVLPVGNTLPDFLSEEYFEKFNYILETAKKLDMEVILYDDTGFPSGTAGGLVEEKYPEDIRKVINKHEVTRTGPSLWKMPVPCGKIMAAVALNTESFERIDLSEYINSDILSWRVPEGSWKIMLFTLDKAPFWKSYFPVDYLDTAAIGRYMNFTYGKYAEQLKPYFQNTIKLSFFDDVGFLRTERTWTHSFNEKFREVNGYGPELYYPALWYDIGPVTEAARVALFNTRSELMAEGYPKMVTQWTRKYGLKNTGHPPGNYAIQPVDMHGDIFKFFRHTDVPLTDLIITYGRGRDGFKLISSASEYYDRPITATEIYGALKENTVDSLMLYRGLMEILARGVNFVIPHGMWYDPDHVSIPPLISPFSEKLAPALPLYSDYVGRTCYLLQGGRRVADIAVLYPIASLQAGFYFDAPENQRAGTWAYPEADYLKISDMLSNEIRRDFTFVHPEFLAGEQYLIRDEKLILNNEVNFQEYSLVIIPGGKVIQVEALQKIRDFYESGGKVIATTLLPSISAEMGQDEVVRDLVAGIFGKDAASNPFIQTNENGGKAMFLANPEREKLENIIREFIPFGDVLFEKDLMVESELGLFSYLHKVRDGKDIYYFANSSDDVIETTVLLKGKKKPVAWNPHDGNTSIRLKTEYINKEGQIHTRCRLKLGPVNSVFWVGND